MGAFDLSFKALLDRLPFQTIRQFGARAIHRDARIDMTQREVSLPLKAVDGACVLDMDGERWVEHFESEVGLSAEDIDEIRRRAQALDLKYNIPVFTSILLMAKRRSPATPRQLFQIQRGTITIIVEPRYIRLWEEPPDRLLEDASIDAVPWIAAMKSTPEQEESMIRTILSVRDPELRDRLSAEAVTLAGLKYDKDKVDEFRQRFRMVTTKEILRASIIGEELIEAGREEGIAKGREEGVAKGREEGIAKGREEGLEKGRAETVRHHIRLLIAARLPGAPVPAWLDAASDIERLEGLFSSLLHAPDPEHARAALANWDTSTDSGR